MTKRLSAKAVADRIRDDVATGTNLTKRVKVRTLLKMFGHSRRSDRNAIEITNLMHARDVMIQPPLVRLGADWELGYNDWLYLSIPPGSVPPDKAPKASLPPSWNDDGWFDHCLDLTLRTEKEVEIKFIVPLLTKLGYSERDRYDGMPIPAARGSRRITLVIDFALFDADSEALRYQPLLTVEAKHETRLRKSKEIENARNQAMSYCLWTQCDFFMVTDGHTVSAFNLNRRSLEGIAPIFSCTRAELKARFGELYASVAKPVLRDHYLSKLKSLDEIRAGGPI